MKTKIFSILLLITFLLTGTAAAETARKVSLMLDWFPNVDHLPIYVARQQGWFAEQGLTVDIISPSETADALKLAAAGKVDLAVSYEPQTIMAAAQGVELTAFGRLIEHPLTTLLYLQDSGITAPADLTGKRIGYTVPGLMDVMLAAFAEINGVRDYTAVNVGFAIVQSLTAGRVDAVMGPFKTYETVEMKHRGLAVGYFELEKWGIPDYDELIFVAGRKTAEDHPETLAAFRGAIARAIAFARANPEAALKLYLAAVPEADRRTETDAFSLTLPYFAHSQDLDQKRWQTFADFALRYGLIERPVAVDALIWRQP